MNEFAIRVENLSKRYRIGLKEELPDTMLGALTGWLKAPLANFRHLRRLTQFEDGRRTTNDSLPTAIRLPCPKGMLREVKPKGHPSFVIRPPTTSSGP